MGEYLSDFSDLSKKLKGPFAPSTSGLTGGRELKASLTPASCGVKEYPWFRNALGAREQFQSMKKGPNLESNEVSDAQVDRLGKGSVV